MSKSTETKPTTSKRPLISHLSTTPHVRAMVTALKKAECFAIEDDRDAGTVKVTYPKTCLAVFRAICKDGRVWIVSRHPSLFE